MQETRGSFVNCTFERNSVESRLQRNDFGGAVSAVHKSHLTVHHCLFKENTATYNGGSTYIQESHINIKQCLFKENTAKYSGGAIAMKETRGSFVNCTFERNSVESRLQRDDFGGAVSAVHKSHLTVHHCLFKENTATYKGGSTYIQESHINIKWCLFTENTANYSGGAIFMQETRGSFVNCTFERNSVESRLQRDDFGGAVSAVDKSHLTVHHCLFKENTATKSGGAIAMEETRCSFVNCTFERNSVESRLQRDNLTVHHCLFKENTANYSGGGIFMEETQGSFVNCTFVDNAVREMQKTFGGAMSSLNGSFSRMTQCFFKKNTATFYGGACYIQRSQGSFENCTFEGKV